MSPSRFSSLFAHDLFRKPLHTFRDHAITSGTISATSCRGHMVTPTGRRIDDGLRALFAPRAMALVGASDDPTRIGGRPLRYAVEAGFKGVLYPVNRRRKEVQGIKAYPDLSSLPQEIDLVVV